MRQLCAILTVLVFFASGWGASSSTNVAAIQASDGGITFSSIWNGPAIVSSAFECPRCETGTSLSFASCSAACFTLDGVRVTPASNVSFTFAEYHAGRSPFMNGACCAPDPFPPRHV